MILRNLNIISYIGFTKKCEMVLRLKRFSYISYRYFRFGFSIELEALSLILLLRVDT